MRAADRPLYRLGDLAVDRLAFLFGEIAIVLLGQVVLLQHGLPRALGRSLGRFFLEGIEDGAEIDSARGIVLPLFRALSGARRIRAEDVPGKFDFIVSRAVTQMPEFVTWIRGKIKPQSLHELANGVLYLKGGDLSEEMKPFPNAVEHPISDIFTDEFFETKKVVYLPLK